MELSLKRKLRKKILGELFELRWALTVYILAFLSLLRNIIGYNIPNKSIKNNVVDESYYIIKYGDVVIQKIYLDYQFCYYLVTPLLEEENLWEGPTVLDKDRKIQHIAYNFFIKWNEFLIDTSDDSSCIVSRNPLFPLDTATDLLFYDEVLDLEKKYGHKITSFIAIYYINRMLNDDFPGIQDIEQRICDLSAIFRHKKSLGWFIALLKIIEKKIINMKEKKEFNISEMIIKLTIIYDKLDDKYRMNAPKFPIILATLLPVCIVGTVPRSISLYGQSKLMMIEVLSQLKQNKVGMEESLLLNSARLLNYTGFEDSLPPKGKANANLHANIASAYSLLYQEIRPNNPNAPNLRRLLLNDPGNVGTFSKEIASVGISQHFDKHEMVILENNDLIKPYEYGIIVENKILAVEIKQYGSYYNSLDKVLREYHRQKSKGAEDLILMIDYCAKNKIISSKDMRTIQEITEKLKKTEYNRKILFVNSADDAILINQNIREATKLLEEDRLHKYAKFVSEFPETDQNKISGKTKFESGDLVRYEANLSSFLGSKSECKEIIKDK